MAGEHASYVSLRHTNCNHDLRIAMLEVCRCTIAPIHEGDDKYGGGDDRDKHRTAILYGGRYHDPGRTRTCNLWFRRPTPYPLGHRATCSLTCMMFTSPVPRPRQHKKQSNAKMFESVEVHPLS